MCVSAAPKRVRNSGPYEGHLSGITAPSRKAPALTTSEDIPPMNTFRRRLWATLAAIVIASSFTLARDDRPTVPPKGGATAAGRVVDIDGHPIAGARVRLYRREGRWQRPNPVVEEVTTGPDGSYRITSPLRPASLNASWGTLPPYLLVADHPGLAVGWRSIPAGASTFAGDIILTAPSPRSVQVVDAGGRPIEGAKVIAYQIGDPESPVPSFQEGTEQIFAGDGPLTALTGPDGRATLPQMPATHVALIGLKRGFAETYAFHSRDTIRLTPSASLSGTVTDPDGRPVVGVSVVLATVFMWDHEQAITDAEGRYRFDDLRARGWDMSTWGQGKTGDGAYKLWLESDRFAVPTQSLVLEPGTHSALDLRAQKAGVIHVTVLEEGTKIPVPGVRVWGFDKETGSSSRFNAYTDAKGIATIHAAPSAIHLSIAGPPKGAFLKGDLRHSQDSARQFDFPGGEMKFTLTMPAIAGRVVSVSGLCTRPDGSRAEGATVSVGAGATVRGGGSLVRGRRADGLGRFTLDGVPPGQTLQLYAETADRRLAGTASCRSPEKTDPAPRVTMALAATVAVEVDLSDDAGKPLANRKVQIRPRVGDDEFLFLERSVETDAQGRLRLDGIVPGLSYRIVEVLPAQGVAIQRGGRKSYFDEVITLAPDQGR